MKFTINSSGISGIQAYFFCMHIIHYMLVKLNQSRNVASEIPPEGLNKGVVYLYTRMNNLCVRA